MTDQVEAQPKKSYSSMGLAVRDNSVEGAKEIVDILKERKQYLSSEEWTTLLFKTLDTLSPEMAGFLKENGADIHASIEMQGEDEGRTVTLPLSHAAIMANNKPLVSWMMDQGWIDEKMVSPAGDTALVFAVRQHAFEVAEIFLEKGMSIDQQNLRGVSALHEAASTGDYVALRWLMDRKADPTLETMAGAVACELVPEQSEEAGEADQLFQDVDDYFQSFKRSRDMVETPAFITMKANMLTKREEDDTPPPPTKKPAMRT